MGRMLDALKRADSTHGETEEPRCAMPRAIASIEAEPACADAEEIPFIEVGPRKSMEASASVLAAGGGNNRGGGLRVEGGGNNSPSTLHPQPSTRNVQFRAVASRGEMRSRFATELVAHHAPEQPPARQYRDVLDAVLQASAANERPTALLFVSALPQTGNTTTLLNVAITAARQARRRVVVVDANLRRPSVADRLGLAVAPGLRETLAGTIALDEVVQPTEQPNLFALTAGVRDNAGMRFVAETMRSLLRQLRESFPLVFVDGPRWDGRPEGIVLAGACDAVYLVVPEQEAETPQIDALLQHIPTQGVRLAGCILVADSSR